VLAPLRHGSLQCYLHISNAEECQRDGDISTAQAAIFQPAYRRNDACVRISETAGNLALLATMSAASMTAAAKQPGARKAFWALKKGCGGATRSGACSLQTAAAAWAAAFRIFHQ
jgi:hypothetical protein